MALVQVAVLVTSHAINDPTTCNFAAGLPVPIPTLPNQFQASVKRTLPPLVIVNGALKSEKSPDATVFTSKRNFH